MSRADSEQRLAAALEAFERDGDEAALEAVAALVDEEQRTATDLVAPDRLDGVLSELRQGPARDRPEGRVRAAPPVVRPPRRWLAPVALAATALVAVGVWSQTSPDRPTAPALRSGSSEGVAAATWRDAAETAVREAIPAEDSAVLMRLHIGPTGAVERLERPGASPEAGLPPVSAAELGLAPAPAELRGTTYDVWIEARQP